MACRCGHDGAGAHPCHANGYQCRKPAKQRFVTRVAALAGAQAKFAASDTWACDECWTAFCAQKGGEG